jgi:hypothetical protein
MKQICSSMGGRAMKQIKCPPHDSMDIIHSLRETLRMLTRSARQLTRRDAGFSLRGAYALLSRARF